MIPTETNFIAWALKHFKCDTARIIKPGGTLFLTIGWNRNTEYERQGGRSEGQWFHNGQPIDFDYVSEQTIASGKTWKALKQSAEHYARLLKLEKLGNQP
jgi:cyclopropane fatty-acyl-phospholipid synthase-like methyltransferase